MYSKILLTACFIISAVAGMAQYSKKVEKCSGDCCKNEKVKDTSISKGQNNFTMEALSKKKVVACKLTSPELRKRKEEVIASLKSKILERKELQDGYKYKFAGTDPIVDEVVAFIKSERLCCDFFSFSFSLVENDLWLPITGPDGAKEFIRTEIDF